MLKWEWRKRRKKVGGKKGESQTEILTMCYGICPKDEDCGAFFDFKSTKLKLKTKLSISHQSQTNKNIAFLLKVYYFHI